MKRTSIEHRFVEQIPADLDEGILYISIKYSTAVHRCLCGCGNEVVTPLSPTDWEITFNGESISLDPSIGNWSFPCQSHYWIEKNKVILDRRASSEEIRWGRAQDRARKGAHFAEASVDPVNTPARRKGGRLRSLVRRLFRE